MSRVGSFDVAAGETVSVDFDVPDGGVTFSCTIDGMPTRG